MPNANKTFAESMTFTRASSATRFNALGVLETVAANVPRINYAPEDIPILGPELVVNGDFSSGAADWTATNSPTFVISDGKANVTETAVGNRWLRNSAPVVIGKMYRVSAFVTITAGTVKPDMSVAVAASPTTSGYYQWDVLASITTIQFLGNSAFIGSIDNISVKEITGYVARKGECLGLLIEEQRTNLQPYSTSSANFNVSSGGLGSNSKTVDYTTAPDGTNTACRFVMSIGGGVTASDISSIAMPGINITSGVTYTGSLYVKSNTSSSYVMKFLNPDGNNVQSVLVTPTWTRLVTTSTSGSTATGNLRLRIRGGESTSDSVDISIWGPQIEQGSFPTSYIPTTTTAAVTRAADLCQVSTAGWFNESEGTFFAEFMGGKESTQGDYGRVIGYGTARTIISVGNMTSVSTWNGTHSITKNGLADTSLNFTKVATKYSKLGRTLAASNMSTVSSNYTLKDSSTPSVPTIFIGGNFNGLNNLNGHIKSIKYIPLAVSDAELQAMTA